MTKTEYRLECLKRSPDLQREVLSFHKKYPPVFVANQSPGQVQLPKWLKPLVRIKSDTIIGNLNTLEHLETLSSFAAECALVSSGFHRLWPEEGSQYFAALGGSSPGQWTKAFAVLKAKWGDIEPGSLRFPWTPLRPRPLLVGAGTRLPNDVLVVIPIHADTTEAEKDHVWRLAMKAKRALYPADRTRRRTRADTYTQRLRVWDAYSQIRNFAKVARELKIPRSSVAGLYLKACSDITGIVPQGAVKKRRVFGFHPKRHATQCRQCHNAKKAEEMCPSALAYLSKEHGSSREIQARPGWEPSLSGRKGNPGGSDRQFKEKLSKERLTGSRAK